MNTDPTDNKAPADSPLPKQGSTQKYKDSLYRDLFDDEETARELFNAVDGMSYPAGSAVKVWAFDDKTLLAFFNDLMISMENTYIALMEHQSTINPNMPLRVLLFIAIILYMETDRGIYGTKKVSIPTPRFYVLYNGRQKPEQTVLRLSDLFKDQSRQPMLESLE
jgi:hypothetical protein